MAWAFQNNVGNLFQGWNIMKTSKGGKRLWSMICPTVCWPLWLERNQRVFSFFFMNERKFITKGKGKNKKQGDERSLKRKTKKQGPNPEPTKQTKASLKKATQKNEKLQ